MKSKVPFLGDFFYVIYWPSFTLILPHAKAERLGQYDCGHGYASRGRGHWSDTCKRTEGLGIRE